MPEGEGRGGFGRRALKRRLRGRRNRPGGLGRDRGLCHRGDGRRVGFCEASSWPSQEAEMGRLGRIVYRGRRFVRRVRPYKPTVEDVPKNIEQKSYFYCNSV